jgi:8-amino-7-oxononanoate synthase
MTTPLLEELAAELELRQRQGLLRRRRVLEGMQGAHVTVDGNYVLSFCSNDYLGLARHPALITAAQRGAANYGVGAGASHLITGHHAAHHTLETRLAKFVGLPAALLFSTGYMANMGIITALLCRHDAVFADKLNHASLNDAALLSRAKLHRYAHCDLASLEKLLSSSKAKRKLVVTDTVFSMDGDLAPVAELLNLCERYDAYLMLDDAHGFGVLGQRGSGVLELYGVRSERIIYMATLGKAAGVFGAFVAGAEVLIETMVQNARSYIYTTATPPLLAEALLASVNLIETELWRREQLVELITLLREQFKLKRWHLMPSYTPIQPLLIGSNEEALRVSEALRERGILVPAIRPPTVPKGEARLRISLSAAHSQKDVMQLVQALTELEG